jgi:hypothetical protein
VDTLDNICVYIIDGADAVSAAAATAAFKSTQPVFNDVAHILCGFSKVC